MLAEGERSYFCPVCKKRYAYFSPRVCWISLCEHMRGLWRTNGKRKS